MSRGKGEATAEEIAACTVNIGSTVDGPDLQGVPVRESSRTTAPTFVKRAAQARDEALESVVQPTERRSIP